jgi:hypothetical protein
MAKKKPAAVPAIVKEPRKIAILGNAGTSVLDAPYKDFSWKIWDMSANFQRGNRFDLWFEMHTDDILKAYIKDYHGPYLQFLKKAGKALIAGHPSEFWPEAQHFPLTEILQRYGDYFTCTFAYMMAFAILLHEKEREQGGPGIGTIGLWGVDMAVDEEYSHQKPCAEYWIGIARGKGIKVLIAPESPICRINAMYAFDNLKLSREFTDRLEDFPKAIAKEEEAYEAAKATMRQHEINIIELRAAQRVVKQICHRWAL